MSNKLNDMQDEAVHCVEGPLLVLAGAGSGKTRVITHRIAYLIDEMGVNPYNILAITFTNKAAKEMRERVDNIIGVGAESVWVSTFHSLCVRILRRYIDRLGYGTNFTIYDTDDQKTVIKECVKKLELDTKMYSEKMLLGEISRAKEQYISTNEYDINAQGEYRKMQIAKVYSMYQDVLRSNNALDFDDLLYLTVELFKHNEDILENYQERFRYIMVDEYQDTNHIQFMLISRLAERYKNLCVVGDDDQSIYKFRGANIYNILNFEQEYRNAKVVKLEQNYRSTGFILKAANGVIAHNEGRKVKALWTDKEDGEQVHFNQYDSEYFEADAIARCIRKLNSDKDISFNQIAILYRTNAQSRVLEEKLMMNDIPYNIYGGTNFYSRKEVKDLICYLKTIANGKDNVAVKRIINVPKRGIGAASVSKVENYSDYMGISLFDGMTQSREVIGLGKTAVKIEAFADYILDMRKKLDNMSISDLYDEILDSTGYRDELINEHTPESETRLENLMELKNKIVQYEESNDEPTLEGLLEDIALVAEIDRLDENQETVSLMTLHSAKGLEFPYVFLSGMEERMFPSAMAINSDDEDAVEEERRLCYVGITRAMKELYLSCARFRMINGSTNCNPISRFVKEIPEDVIMSNEQTVKAVEREKRHVNDSSMEAFKSKPYFGREFVVEKMDTLDYKEGDKVKHIKFGVGTVLEIVSGGKDYEVTVDFDNVGVKKMFASFAKLKKID